MSREKQIVETLLTWHRENRRSFPWRDESDPYKVLVAEFFLQRTPAERVAKIYPKFIEKYPTPEDLANADPSSLIIEYGSLGLKKRMKWLVESMKILIKQFGGRIPKSKKLLKKLPGIGEYTASAILCFAFGKNIEIIDSNVIKVYSRIYGTKNHLNIKCIKKIAEKITPKIKTKEYNIALLDFAANMCKSKPLCNLCPINTFCSFYLSS